MVAAWQTQNTNANTAAIVLAAIDDLKNSIKAHLKTTTTLTNDEVQTRVLLRQLADVFSNTTFQAPEEKQPNEPTIVKVKQGRAIPKVANNEVIPRVVKRGELPRVRKTQEALPRVSKSHETLPRVDTETQKRRSPIKARFSLSGICLLYTSPSPRD